MNRERAYFPEVLPCFSVLPAPTAPLRASVIVPARDEAANIVCALDALAAQRDLNDEPLDPTTFEIILLANNCRDQTAAIARRWAAQCSHVALHVVETEFESAHACVGWARRALMNAACARLQALPASQHPRAICSTDADTRVSPFWIAHTLEELRIGADAVGGRILLDREDPLTRRTYLLDTAYRLLAARLESALDPQIGDDWPRHFQFFGASLAIRPDVYAQIGGLPVVRCLEDVALETELVRRDLLVRHSPHVVARTSARRSGRVETGLSTQLREWEQAGGFWLVPPGEEIALRARLKRRLRAQFPVPNDDAEIEALARELGVAAARFWQMLEATPTFGRLWQDVQCELQGRFAPVAVEVALAQLRALLAGRAAKS